VKVFFCSQLFRDNLAANLLLEWAEKMAQLITSWKAKVSMGTFNKENRFIDVTSK